MVCNPTCPYCLQPSKLVNGAQLYAREELAHLKFYLCAPCGAYVGTHRGTEKALGSLANRELRSLRNKTHAAFDPLWIGYKYVERRRIARTKAYAWLGKCMGLRPDETHIAMFNEEQCKLAIQLCKECKDSF